jgi:alkylation response protein AidB-like acyl-CoA dehydrogenase
MDLSLSADHKAFQTEVRAFLDAHWQPSTNDAAIMAFRRLATERGYLYRSIPHRYGGSEQSPDMLKAQIVAEAFAAVKAPMEVSGAGTQMLVPTLLEHGADWQKDHFIRPAIEGSHRWCQGYSEPGAGSDLASLRTRGQRVGDAWVINGQKIWTSHAHVADYMFALVRTEPDAPKHEGLSYLLIDMRQPGIEVRPLRQINGASEFNEVFFTDARTPANWIVGKPGAGWQVSRSLLRHERNMLAGSDRTEGLFKSLLRLARTVTRHGRPAIEDPAVRDRLAVIYGYCQTQKYSGLVQLTRELRGEDPGRLQLMNKLAQSEFAKALSALATDLVGDDALVAPGGKGPGGQGFGSQARWMNQFFGSIGTSIAGGTSNIQRNIIAERGLGLPRDRAAG